MRVLVVDQDSASNEAISRLLREHYVVDAVTNKGDCLDLLRSNVFEVIVAGERLEDGSGLELLGTVSKKYSNILRIFAADRHRLQLLKGRLGPFELFQTLVYPIDPDKLLSTLQLADAVQDAHADTSNIQHVVLSGTLEQPQDEAEQGQEPEQEVDQEQPDAFPAPRPEPRAAVASQTSRGARQAQGSRESSTSRDSSTSRVAGDSRASAASRASASSRSAGVSRAEPGTSGARRETDSAPSARSAVARNDNSQRVRSGPGQRPRRASATGSNSTRPALGAPTARTGVPNASRPSVGTAGARHARVRGGSNKAPPVRFPPLEPPQQQASAPSDSFAETAAMAREARDSRDESPDEFDYKRIAVLVGWGAVVLGVIVLGFRLFGSKSEAPKVAAAPAVHAPEYPPEVTDLIAQTEAALKDDDFKSARADVDKLHELAPSHPRLAFFEGLLAQKSTASKVADAAHGGAGGHGSAKHGSRKGSAGSSDDRSSEAGGQTAMVGGDAGRAVGGAGGAATSGAAGAGAGSGSAGDLASSSGLAPETPPGMSRAASATTSTPAGSATASSAAAGTANPVGDDSATASTSAGHATEPSTASTAGSTSTAKTASSTSAASSAGSASATSAATTAAPTASSNPSSAAAGSTPAPSSATSSTRRANSDEPPPVVQEAKLIRRVNPDYPSSAKKEGIEGSVDLQVTVSQQGLVRDATVVTSTPPDVFDKAALAAVRKWKYDPRFVDGLPSEAQLKVHLDFKPGQ